MAQPDDAHSAMLHLSTKLAETEEAGKRLTADEQIQRGIGCICIDRNSCLPLSSHRKIAFYPSLVDSLGGSRKIAGPFAPAVTIP